VASKKTKEQLQNWIKDGIAKDIQTTQPAVEVEGLKLPVQPVVLKGGVPATVKLSADYETITLIGNQIAGTALPADHDPVNHPSYYTSHLSGVEAIDLSEVLSFNTGNAFKYVFRRDGKLNPVQDLQKAKWYIEREIKRLNESWLRFIPTRLLNLVLTNPDLSDYHLELAAKVVSAETDLNAKSFYKSIFFTAEVKGYADYELKNASACIDKLIKGYEAKAKTQARAASRKAASTKAAEAKAAKSKTVSSNVTSVPN
jgi:hypothetical protein